MKSTELMIGDWLIPYNETEPRRVEHLTYQYEMSGKYDVVAFDKNPYTFNYTGFCKPVPITREILEKNGFVCREERGSFVAYSYSEESYSNQTVEITLFHVESEYKNNQLHICEFHHPNEVMLHLMKCNYVHKLQHALRLCGIDMEITL